MSKSMEPNYDLIKYALGDKIVVTRSSIHGAKPGQRLTIVRIQWLELKQKWLYQFEEVRFGLFDTRFKLDNGTVLKKRLGL